MSRDDDPEARIRELERAMTDQARASELTEPGQGWSSRTPAAGTPYTGPAELAAQRPYRTTGKKHLTFLPPSSNHQPSVSVAAPTPPQPGDESSVVVNGTTVQSGPGLVELPPQSDDPNRPIQVAGVRGHRTVACNDRPISISGVSNSVTITGHCATVEVSGIENTVTVDSADKIVTSGMDNHVTYHSGTPEIPDPGRSNTVSRG
ncbi:DUF3060 domain-containing protein [Mycolicibacterium phocaicum]|uniref:DUF3060 domain-containing protein n=1 Tax=Mycolicibacterium phocaicum TaxID=319706 RepID=UPI00138D4417|nr:DUF3060 domain-containing protein [Mycolicibacterium phocaicum]BBZ55673.1 hypothetical protein MPHO_26650 [Mycolicibacterium phocaicum]